MQQGIALEHTGNLKTVTIDRRTCLSREDFLNEYVNKSLSVVLTGAAKNWPAMGKHTPEFLKKPYGHITKTIDGVTYTMDEAIDMILVSTKANRAPSPFNFDIKKGFSRIDAGFFPTIGLR